MNFFDKESKSEKNGGGLGGGVNKLTKNPKKKKKKKLLWGVGDVSNGTSTLQGEQLCLNYRADLYATIWTLYGH